MKRFSSDVRSYGLKVAFSNVRFNVAYRLGGFTKASR